MYDQFYNFTLHILIIHNTTGMPHLKNIWYRHISQLLLCLEI